MRNIIYIRTSTKEQSPELQLKDIKLTFGELQEAIIFEDKQSAFKDNIQREGFNELLNLIKKKEIENIYVWDWDRLYRNRNKLKGFFQMCLFYNVNIHSHR